MAMIIPAPPGTFWQSYKPDEDGDPVREPVFAISVPSVDDTRPRSAGNATHALNGSGKWLLVQAPSLPGAADGIAGRLGYWQSL